MNSLHFSHSARMDVECQVGEEFLGAHHGKQLLVVEGSGRRGRRESVSQVLCHL